MGNTAIWDRLCKTDPKHTKSFKRAGGFAGTAIKPIWSVHRMTEVFGACGLGWGVNEPTFQVVHGNDEALVFCTVSIWHGSRENVVFGVGGDKAMGKNKYGPFTDDEAFKKAFTDAVSNAMKFVGVGADVHMGMFDDNKYVSALRAEFSETAQAVPDGYLDGAEPIPPEHVITKDDTIPALTVDVQRPIFSELEKEMKTCTTVEECKRWKLTARSRASRLSSTWREDLNIRYLDHLREIEKRDADEYITRKNSHTLMAG